MPTPRELRLGLEALEGPEEPFGVVHVEADAVVLDGTDRFAFAWRRADGNLGRILS